jgi:mono/diheme cytochrome c family protein
MHSVPLTCASAQDHGFPGVGDREWTSTRYQANEASPRRSLWGEVSDAFQSGDVDTAWEGFQQAKAGCIACHAAEGVPFMNSQPMFELGRPH